MDANAFRIERHLSYEQDEKVHNTVYLEKLVKIVLDKESTTKLTFEKIMLPIRDLRKA